MKTYSVSFIVGVVLAFFLFSFFVGKALGMKTGAGNNTVDKAKNQLDPKKLSYPLSQYSTFAEKIWEACGGLIGVDENTIFNVFQQLKNESDLNQLIVSFGIRTNPKWRVLGDDRNLAQTLYYFLSEKDRAKINGILTTKGINYSF